MFEIPYIQQQPFPEKILWFLGITFAGWVLTKLILWVWEKLILPVTSKTESSLDDHLSKNTHKPVTRLLILGSIYLAAQMTIVSASEVRSFMVFIENLIYLILVLFVANLVDAIFKSLIDWYLDDIASKTESTLDETLFPVIRKAGAAVIYFIAATIILGQFKVNLTGFLATAGVASLAIAFGAQETLANIIAGISILIDRSFHVGERIELKDGLIGDVVEIGLRSTRIMSLDQRLIIVPNKEIAGSRLINWSQPDESTKVKLKIGLGMEEDLARVKKVIADVCAKEPLLSKKTPVAILGTGYGPYFIELLIVGEVEDCRDSGLAIDNLIVNLQKAFKQEKIQLPNPLQQIQLKQSS